MKTVPVFTRTFLGQPINKGISRKIGSWSVKSIKEIIKTYYRCLYHFGSADIECILSSQIHSKYKAQDFKIQSVQILHSHDFARILISSESHGRSDSLDIEIQMYVTIEIFYRPWNPVIKSFWPHPKKSFLGSLDLDTACCKACITDFIY